MIKISLDFDSDRIKEIKKIQECEQRKYFKEQSDNANSYFLSVFFIVIIWFESGADQKLELLKSIFLYYGATLGILVSVYSYNRARDQ